MNEEDQLYHESGFFVRLLLLWSSSLSTLVQRIIQLIEDISEAGFWKSKEIQVINDWVNDLHLTDDAEVLGKMLFHVLSAKICFGKIQNVYWKST